MGRFNVGDVVQFGDGVAIVSLPISDQAAGHVLTLRDGFLVGHAAAVNDVAPVGDESEGFVQLAHKLIRLGSLLIEERLLVYRH